MTSIKESRVNKKYHLYLFEGVRYSHMITLAEDDSTRTLNITTGETKNIWLGAYIR